MNNKLLLTYLKNKQNGNQEFIAFKNSIRKNSNLKPITILESPGDPQWGSNQNQPPPGDLSNWTWITYTSPDLTTGGYWVYNGDSGDNVWQWDSTFGYWTITINGVLYWSLGQGHPIEQSGPQQMPEQLDGWGEYFSREGLPDWPWYDFLSKLEEAFTQWLSSMLPVGGSGPGGITYEAIKQVSLALVSMFGADIAAYIIANNWGSQLIGATSPNVWTNLFNAFQPGSPSFGIGAWNNLMQIFRGVQSGQSIGALFAQGGAINGVTMGTLIRSLALAGLGVGAILSIIASWWHIYNILQDPNWDSSTPPPISHKDIWNFLRQPVPQVDSPESLAPTPTVIPGGYPGAPGPSGTPPPTAPYIPPTFVGPYMTPR